MTPADSTRIHVEVQNELHMRLKAAAALSGMTLKAAVTEAIEQWVKNKTKQAKT